MNTLFCTSNDTTDVTVAFQNAINNTPSGDILYVPYPDIAYLVSDTLQITRPINIVGQKSTIHFPTNGKPLFNITSDNVVIRNMGMKGPQYLANSDPSRAIQAKGPNAGAPLVGLLVDGCIIDGWGGYGVHMLYVNKFKIQNNLILNINYSGITGCSVMNGRITGNLISNIIAAPNAYGVQITRVTNDANELTANPRSIDVLIKGNHVEYVVNWEGIDTHSGQRIRIIGNNVIGCNRGICVVDSKNAINKPTYGPHDCVVMGNTVDSLSADGSKGNGIVLSGSSNGLGVEVDWASGCTIVGNTVRNYGLSENDGGMAIYLVSTSGAVVSGNTLVESGKCGIGLDNNNDGFAVYGNTIRDTWSNTKQTWSISVNADYNTGAIYGNSLVRGKRTAPRVNEIGLNIKNFVTPHNYVVYSPNYCHPGFIQKLQDPGGQSHPS